MIEPLILIEAEEKGYGYEYKLDDLTQIQVTDSFIGLDEHVRECQTIEPLFNCTTRKYLATLVEKCGCLPLNIRMSNEVTTKRYFLIYVTFFNASLIKHFATTK